MADSALLDHERFEALKKAVAEVGYFRRGSLARCFMPCGKSSCACQGSPPRLHGPYYQWTRKVHGKTVTVRLTSRQAKLLSTWVANARQFDRLRKQMERTAQRLTDRRLRQLREP